MLLQRTRLLWSFASISVGLVTVLLLVPARAQARVIVSELPLARDLQVAKPLWRWPLAQPFAARAFLKPSSDWGAGHRGLDLESNPDEAVVAPLDGEITFSGQAFGTPTIVITQGELSTVVQPACSDDFHLKGSNVEAGEKIGRMCLGSEKHHCGDAYCLHWSCRYQNEEYLNPLLMVGLLEPARLYANA
ncbi:MAG: Murein hydrolase activator NlpD precursor [Actinomycetota bacterium]|jgi:murein DD-endopeptidase MepM/ murein hydrolase activator NlpD